MKTRDIVVIKSKSAGAEPFFCFLVMILHIVYRSKLVSSLSKESAGAPTGVLAGIMIGAACVFRILGGACFRPVCAGLVEIA